MEKHDGIKVSVIVPVYNTFRYLEQCLNSILNQTLKEFEVICVNDGSTDDSAKILEKYSQKDKRIVVINQENAGASAARNAGLDCAKGRYIAFVDSDDYIKKNFLEVLYTTAVNTEADITACDIIYEKDGKLICLFGCGGDRDATKRPKMGAIAERIADKIIITSDNPRSEDPQQIITDIIAGLKNVNTETVTVEPDRGHAIALLKTIAGNNDVVIIAGKGHEDYQILKDRTIHFDDREEAKKVFEGSVI